VAQAQALEEKQGARAALEASLMGLEESHNLNISKLTKDHDHTLALAKVLKNERVSLMLVMLDFLGILRNSRRPTKPWRENSHVSPSLMSNFKLY
jgi:hypothetical protein